MIETIKDAIYDILKDKQVSLAMVYDKEGQIIWSRGRNIIGKDIYEGEGFSKTFIQESLKSRKVLERSNGIISSDGLPLSKSANRLLVKSIMIYPISSEYYLYCDSGYKESFTSVDVELFKLLGKLLSSTVIHIMEKEKNIGGITGNSKQIKKIREKVLLYSLTDETLLLLGETGTGKNHIAKFIHDASGKTGKFVTLNTPGIPETLLESELFGYKKGAFTGAIADKKGLIEEAENGTLFIDEIGEVSIHIQSKLLRFFDEKKFIRVGDTIEKTGNVRIIAATNANLNSLIKEKKFREDLFYRISGFTITIPPLRERKEDIKSLVLENIELLNNKKIKDNFWTILENYSWPGNVRELFSVLRRLGVESKGEYIDKDVNDYLLNKNKSESDNINTDTVDSIWKNFSKGKTFWEVIREPYLDRELNKNEVKSVVEEGLKRSGMKYTNLISLFNLKEKEYKKFMNFLLVHKINVNKY